MSYISRQIKTLANWTSRGSVLQLGSSILWRLWTTLLPRFSSWLPSPSCPCLPPFWLSHRSIALQVLATWHSAFLSLVSFVIVNVDVNQSMNTVPYTTQTKYPFFSFVLLILLIQNKPHSQYEFLGHVVWNSVLFSLCSNNSSYIYNSLVN